MIGKRLRTIMEGHRTASVKGNGPYKSTSKVLITLNLKSYDSVKDLLIIFLHRAHSAALSTVISGPSVVKPELGERHSSMMKDGK